MNSRIKKLRKDLKLTLEKFGSVIGVSDTAVSAWETGTRNVPESVRRQICSTFNVNRDWLETGEGEMFLRGKSPEQLDSDAFARVACQLLDDLSDDLRGLVVNAVKRIADEEQDEEEEQTEQE